MGHAACPLPPSRPSPAKGEGIFTRPCQLSWRGREHRLGAERSAYAHSPSGILPQAGSDLLREQVHRTCDEVGGDASADIRLDDDPR
jgi:hypothetical protein